ALALLLVVALAGSFLVRAASIKNLHYVVLPKALLVFLDEPAGVSQSKIESEITRILADQDAPSAAVPLFYVLSKKETLHHLLIDSGFTRDDLTHRNLQYALWNIARSSASLSAS